MSRTLNILHDEYFEWMYNLVCGDEYVRGRSYRKLFSYLHGIEFVYILDMDVNRAKDGINLRYQFAYEYDRPNSIMISDYLSDDPCSVLEMLVALANRCEVQIMSDPAMGDRTGEWFWIMLNNLGMRTMDDEHFDDTYVDEIVHRLLYREYKRNGEGGLFTIDNCENDLRNVEIWYQMCWYLNTII